MTVTVPTWTVVLPLLLILIGGLCVTLHWIDAHWVAPRIDRWLAKRWGISVEEMHAARAELRKRGEL